MRADADACIYLASQSPRRAELLRQVGVPFRQLLCSYREEPDPQAVPRTQALRLAEGKSDSGWRQRDLDLPVLAADTLVELDGEVLGKPRNRAHALAMLRALSGREHTVHTGVAVTLGERRESLVNSTRVQFAEISETRVQAYWRTGEPADKAGAYAIQGLGAMFVVRLRGSYSSVVGLPLFETVELLGHYGIRPLHEPQQGLR